MTPNEHSAARADESAVERDDVPAAWAARGADLASWALERFFVRTDRHGGYEIESEELVKKTFPKAGSREGAVSAALLERHFRARSGADVVGAHTLAPGTSAGKWCAIDCDNHGDDPALPELNRRYAEGRHAFLTKLGFRPLVLDYGKGSFHLVVVFDRTLPGAVLKRFAEWFRGDARHEAFPKQAEVPEGKFGNWLRLVGRHHKREVWARVYDGTSWLDGAEAVAHLLALTGDSPDLMPEHVRFPEDEPANEQEAELPRTAARGSANGESVFEKYNCTVTLDEMIRHCIAAGHQLLKSSADRATFTRAGKTSGESFNLKATDETVFCYNFSSNAELPKDTGLNPSHTRCALMFGTVDTEHLAQLAPLLEAELGIRPRRMSLEATRGSAALRDASAEIKCAGTTIPEWWQPPAAGETWTDPNRLARLFERANATPDGTSTLVQWRDVFFQWDGSAYSVLSNSDINAELNRHVRQVFEIDLPVRRAEAEAAAADKGDEGPTKATKIPSVTIPVCNNTRGNLTGLINVRDDGRDPPFWLRGDSSVNPKDVIVAPNGLFTLERIARGDPPFAAPTPNLFALNALPFEPHIGECNAPPVWCEKLEEWFNGDHGSIHGLQEWFGYMLSASTVHHKILMLVGPKRSGKSTVLRVITNLVGSKHVASTTFAALSETFGLHDLMGKRVAMIPDARLSGRADTATVVERLLSVSGDDAQSVNRKNKDRLSVRLGVRFVLATNEMPNLADASGAFASRFHILSMPNSFYGREDKQLDAKLEAERPAILQWAARGYVRLVEQGAFTQNAAADQYHQLLEELSSPVRAFVREWCRIGPTEQIPKSELYAAWCAFCKDRSLPTTAANVFSRDLQAVCPLLRDTHPRLDDGKRVHCFQGIGLCQRDKYST